MSQTMLKRKLLASIETSDARDAAHELGLTTLNLPEGLRIRDTETHRFVFNYTALPITWDGVEIPAAGVHWTAR